MIFFRHSAFTCALVLLLSLHAIAENNQYQVDIHSPPQIKSREFLHSIAVDGSGRVFTVTPDEQKLFWFDGSEWHAVEFDGVPRMVFRDQKGDIVLTANIGAFRIAFDVAGRIKAEKIPIQFSEQDDPSLLQATLETDEPYLFNHRVRVNLNAKTPTAEPCPAGFAWADTSSKESLLIPSNKAGLFSLTGESLTPIVAFEDKNVQGAKLISSNRIAAWTTNGKFFLHEQGVASPFTKVNEAVGTTGRIFSAIELANGNLGLTSTAGFFECTQSGDIVNIINQRDGLKKDIVYRAFENDGMIWLTRGRSIAKLTASNNTRTFRVTDGSSKIHDYVNEGNDFCFCVDYGAQLFSTEDQTAYEQCEPLGSAPIYSIHRDQELGIIVAATTGLYRYRNKKIDQLSKGRFYSLLPLSEGLTLSSNQNGTVILIDHRESPAKLIEGPQFPFEVRYLYPYDEDYVMVVGWNGDWGMARIDVPNTRFQKLSNHSELRFSMPVEISGEKAFLLDAGVFQVEVKGQEIVTAPANISESLQTWVSQNQPRELLEVAEGEYFASTSKFVQRLKEKNDSLVAIETWPLSGIGKPLTQFDEENQTVSFVDHDKFMMVDLTLPSSPTPEVPKPIIASSRGTAIGNGKQSQINLPAKGGTRFTFSCPAHSNWPQNVQYQYRLTGFDDQWSEWGDYRQKEYTNLSGGNYSFEVRAKSALGQMSSVESLSFHVATPWYQTPFAYLLYLTALIGLILGIGNLRSRRLTKANQEMERVVKLRTQQLEFQKDQVRLKSDQLIQQTQDNEAERLNSLSRMLGCIAHDFNNLLFVVSSNCETLEISLEPSLLPMVEGIKAAGKTAAGLCAQIQSFSAATPSVRQEISLSKEAATARDLLKSAAGEINVEFNCGSDSGLVSVDPTGLQQIMLNLVVNASEAGSKNIVVQTGTSKLKPDELARARMIDQNASPGKYHWIEIKDDGDGISEEHLNKIFDPFFSTKRLGRGLGLSIVIRMVTSNHGLLFVDSDDSGTTFRVCFPAIKGATTQPATTADPNRASGELNVMIVDDDSTVVQALSACARQYTQCVKTASNGDEAIALLKQGFEPDVILMDVSMPDKNGDIVAQEMFASGFEFKIVLMSGFNSDKIPTSLLSRPNVDFVRKPFRIESLLSRIADEQNSTRPNFSQRPKFNQRTRNKVGT